MNIELNYIIYAALERAGLPPIFNYSSDNHPNFGSIVWINKAPNKEAEITVGEWRIMHPDYGVSLAYGFQCVADADLNLLGAGHGKALAIKSPNPNISERYYPWTGGAVQVDTLLMPKQSLIDFGTIPTKNKSQYFHYPDLMWFNPYPTNEVMEKELLLKKIQRRMIKGEE